MSNPSYWIGYSYAPPTNVEYLYHYWYQYLYNCCSKLIIINNLPEELEKEHDFIMQCLLLNGRVFFFKEKSKMYALNGNLGGDITTYYHPDTIRTVNPILGSIERTQDKDGELVWLTPMDKAYLAPNQFKTPGLTSLINIIAWLLADNVSSINCAQINTRVCAIYTAEDENSARAAELVLKGIYKGEPYKVVTSEMLKKFGVNPLSTQANSKTLTELIETHQYILAMFWNSIGIDCNSNMKRERLVTAEVEKNVQGLAVPIETMLETINDGLTRANAIFGTNMSAVMNPAYKQPEPEEKSGDITNDTKDSDISGDGNME